MYFSFDFFAGDPKIVKKDAENVSMETTPSEQPAAPATNEPTVATSGKYIKIKIFFNFFDQ